MNGAFQLFNPLKRLASGEMLTRDFDFFHGIGTLLIHYPIFQLAGGDLFASEIAKNLLSPIAFLLSFLIVGKALRLPPWISGAGAAVTYALGDITGIGTGTLSGNSMIGLRSTFPILAIPFAILIGRIKPLLSKPLVFHALVGIFLGCSWFIATEQGLAAFAVHAFILAVIPAPGIRFSARAVHITILTATFAITYLLLIGVVSGWRISETVTFCLADLSKDQFWYYGAPPNPLAGWHEFFQTQELLVGFWLPFGFFLIESVYWLRDKKRRMDPSRCSVLILIICGMSMAVQLLHLATLSHYHMISVRNMGIVAMIWSFRLIQASFPVRWSRWLQHPAMLTAAFVGLCALSAQRVLHVRSTLERRAENLGGNRTHGRVRLSKDWQKDLEVWQELAKPGATVSGTYRSLPDDVNPGHFGGPDYIIHALGGKRDRFLASLVAQKPDFFHTINPRYSNYEEWLQLRHWDVYRHLLENYKPIATSPYHVFWRQQPKVLPFIRGVDLAFKYDEDKLRWASPVHKGRRSLYEVSVYYETRNPITAVPFFGKLPRYFLDRAVVSQAGAEINGLACSLPPHKTTWLFPMVLDEGYHAVLTSRVFMPTPGAELKIASVTMKPLPADPDILDALTGSDQSHLFAGTLNPAIPH